MIYTVEWKLLFQGGGGVGGGVGGRVLDWREFSNIPGVQLALAAFLRFENVS